MQISDVHTIFLFIIFFVPGCIFMESYSLVIPTGRIDYSKSWQKIVVYSIVFSGATYFLYDLAKFEHIAWANNLILILGIFIVPAITPFLFLRLQNIKWFHDNMLLPHPTAWDYIFNKRKSYWVILNLKSGDRIGGIYDVNSYTSAFPYEHDIYIEKIWELDEDGGFIQQIEQSAGMWVQGSEISAIEFFVNSIDENGDDECEQSE